LTAQDQSGSVIVMRCCICDREFLVPVGDAKYVTCIECGRSVCGTCQVTTDKGTPVCRSCAGLDTPVKPGK
jgi:hypothetical protein